MPSEINNILIVRLGAMGDIIHALPGVAALRRAFQSARITWVVEQKWASLIEGSGLVDRIAFFHRRKPDTWLNTRRELRSHRYDLAVDFQGSIKSALVAHFAGPERIVGFAADIVRERPAAWFYSRRVTTKATHVVDQALDLVADVTGAKTAVSEFPLPPGAPEGTLPDAAFALACPLAGWTSKQWPFEYYEKLAGMIRSQLGMPLVLNGMPGSLPDVPWAMKHESGIPGLIDATRKAALVIGVDSGPLHLAAALNKSGAAIFGPTDPARNGPRGGNFQVFRADGVATTHRREETIHPAMRQITPEQVFAALARVLASRIGCHA